MKKQCEVVRSFPYSPDGVTVVKMVPGPGEVEESSFAGLEVAGFIRSPETKVIESSPERKIPPPPGSRTVARGPRGKWYVVENGNRLPGAYDTEEAAKEAAK